MAASYRLVLRDGPRVTRSRHASIDEALDALQAHVVALQDDESNVAALRRVLEV